VHIRGPRSGLRIVPILGPGSGRVFGSAFQKATAKNVATGTTFLAPFSLRIWPKYVPAVASVFFDFTFATAGKKCAQTGPSAARRRRRRAARP